MKRMMQRRLPLCTQIIGLICLLPLVCCQHDLCVRPSSCDYGAVLPDPDDCQSYYECTDRRRWEHQTCHNSELFDVVKMACIKKNQAVCVDCDATTPTVVDSTVACAPPIPCVLDSVLGNPLSCTSYQMCFTANNWKVFDCPSGLYFDIISYQCIRGNEEYTCQPTCESVTRDYDPRDMNNENEASTASQIRTIEPALLETACNIVPGGTCSLLTFGAHSYPDVHDCENFYLCTDTWESFSCNSLPGDEGPYYYDAVSMACRQTTEAITCAAPCTTTIPTTTRSTGPTIDPDILEQACSAYDGAPCNRNAAYLPNPVDCGSFFICLVTAWKKISCPPGQLFDALSDEGCGEVDEVICSPPCPGMTTENTFTTAASTSTTSTTISTLLPTTTTSSYPHTSTEILTTEGLLTSSSGEYSSSNPPFTIGEITHEQTGNPTIAAHKQDTTTVADTTSGEPTTHPDTTSTAAITSTTSTIQQSTTSFQPTVQLSTLSSSAIQPDATPDASTPFQTPLPSTSSEYETTDYPTTTSLSTAIPSFTSEETSRPSITTNHDSTSPLFSTETTPEPEFTTFKPPTHVPHSTTKSTLPSIMTTSDIRSSEPYSSTTVMIGGFCPAEVDVQSGDLVWPETTAGTVARLEVCHLGLEGYVSRKCVRTADGGAQWDDLNFGMCVDTIYQQLLDEAEHMMSSGDPTGVEVTTILELAVELAEVTANDTRAAGGMTPGNLNATVVTIVLLSDITDVGYHGDGSGSGVPEGGNTGEEIAQEVIECVSSILSPENGNGWEELLKLDPNRAVSILNIVDEVAERLAETAEPGRDISIVTNTVVVEVFPMEADETETVVFQGMTSMSPTEDPQIDTIAIPMATLANLAEEMQMDKVVVYGTYYNALGPYLPPSGDMILNSRIISLSIRDVPFGTHLNPSVQMNFTLLNKSIDDVVLMCGYWNYTSRTSGYWSSEGCTMRHHSFTQASCECNHLTNFAVLMSPYAPAPHHVKILSLITIIGCLLSITGCLATLCLYIIAWKRIASEHAAVMLNLCVVLILANGLFLAGIERTENWIACTSVAALLHYLYLTACMIMLADGIEFVLYVMYVFHVKRRKETLLLLATCYVVPATIVGISLSVTKLEGYGTDEYCWLAKENGLLGAFIGPVVVITLANFIILIKVLQTAAGSKAREHKGKFWSTIWNVTVILPLLGITWIFGIIAINEETVYFQYVFASLNSLQGFFIFIFHCALNKKLREAVVLKFSGRGSTTSSVLSGKSAKSTKSKKSIVSNLSGESDKSGKSDKKSMLSRKKKDIDAKSNKGKGKIKGSKTGTYANGDIENAVYSEYITPSRAAAQNGYVQEVSGENDLYCDIIEANMNPQNDLNKGIRRHYDKSPFSGRSDKFAKPDDRKSFERSSMTSVKSHQKKDVAEEFLIMEPEYIDDNREIHFIDNRSFFDDTANDNPYMEIDNLEDNSSVDQWTRYQISHSGDESVVQQPQHWIRYQISNDGSDPHYINGAAEHMDGVA